MKNVKSEVQGPVALAYLDDEVLESNDVLGCRACDINWGDIFRPTTGPFNPNL